MSGVRTCVLAVAIAVVVVLLTAPRAAVAIPQSLHGSSRPAGVTVNGRLQPGGTGAGTGRETWIWRGETDGGISVHSDLH